MNRALTFASIILAAGIISLNGQAPGKPSPAAGEGIAVAIVYDTSGSMRDVAAAGAGVREPKYLIANRALQNIINRLQSFATQNPGRPVSAGLFVFSGNVARPAVPFGPLPTRALQDWVRSFAHPDGGTPLGQAVRTAGEAVLASAAGRRHILVITDGINTIGLDPATALTQLRADPRGQAAAIGVHFVAFDVAARVFDGVKKQGATVVSASDETQLNSQLQFILEKKILLEDEEPAPAKPRKPQP
jgi:hypothetical protein